MMRTLMILRHAKSRWDEPGKPDFERSLAPRGVNAAGLVGREIQKRDYVPQLVLCSTAVRAQSTFELINAELQDSLVKADLPALYMATPDRIGAIIKEQDPSLDRMMVLGHNPGLHSYCLEILNGDAPPELVENLPTAALLIVRFKSQSWRRQEPAEFVDLILPRQLAVS